MFLSTPQFYAQAHAKQQRERLAREQAIAEERRGRSRVVSPTAVARVHSEERRALWAQELQRSAHNVNAMPPTIGQSSTHLLPFQHRSRRHHKHLSLSPLDTPSSSPPTTENYFSSKPGPSIIQHSAYGMPSYADDDWESCPQAPVYPDQDTRARPPSPPIRQTSQARALAEAERTKAKLHTQKQAWRRVNLKQKEVLWDCARSQALQRAHMLFLDSEDSRITRENEEIQKSMDKKYDESMRRAEDRAARGRERLAAELAEDETAFLVRLPNAVASGCKPHPMTRPIHKSQTESTIFVQSRARLLAFAPISAIPPRKKAARKPSPIVVGPPDKPLPAEEPNPVYVPFKDVFESMRGELFPVDPSEQQVIADAGSVESHASSRVPLRSTRNHSRSRGRSDFVMAEGYSRVQGHRQTRPIALSTIEQDSKDITPSESRTRRPLDISARKTAQHKAALLASLLVKPSSSKKLVEPTRSSNTSTSPSRSGSSSGDANSCSACSAAASPAVASPKLSPFSGLFGRRMPPRSHSGFSATSSVTSSSAGWFSFGSSGQSMSGHSVSTAATSFSGRSVASRAALGRRKSSNESDVLTSRPRHSHSCPVSRLTPVDAADSPLPIPKSTSAVRFLGQLNGALLASRSLVTTQPNDISETTPVSRVMHLIRGLNDAYISASVFSVTAQTQAQINMYHGPLPTTLAKPSQSPGRRSKPRRFRRKRPGYAATRSNVKTFTAPTCCIDPSSEAHSFCPPLDLFRRCFPSTLSPMEIPFPVYPPPTPPPRTQLSYPTPDPKFAPVIHIPRPPDRPLLPEHQYRNLCKLQICVPRPTPFEFEMELERQRRAEIQAEKRASQRALRGVEVVPVNPFEIPRDVIEEDREMEAEERRCGLAVRAGMFIDGRWQPGPIRERLRIIPNPAALRIEALRNRGWSKKAGMRDGVLTAASDRVYAVAFEGRGRSQLSL